MAEGFETINFNTFDRLINIGDANNITKSGVYFLGQQSDNTPTELTSTSKFIIQIGTRDGGMQICKPYYPWDYTYGVYIRNMYAGSFGSWKKIAWVS